MRPRPAIPGGPYLVVGLARSGVAAALALRARGEEVLGLDAGSPAAAGALGDAGVELYFDETDGRCAAGSRARGRQEPGRAGEAPVIAARARARHAGARRARARLAAAATTSSSRSPGTNGKTTTVELIGHIHRRAGLPVAVAGNVGTPLSSLVGVARTQRATVVCEASSFQLEDTLAFAPEAAVLLNLAPDHLDRHGTFEAYAAAKLQVFARQRAAATSPVAPAPSSTRLQPTLGRRRRRRARVRRRRGACASAGTRRRRCSSSTASCGGATSR